MKKYYKLLAVNDGYSEQSDKIYSLVEAWKRLKEIKEFDKQVHINVKYAVGKYQEDDENVYVTIGKVYRRGNKIFFKAI